MGAFGTKDLILQICNSYGMDSSMVILDKICMRSNLMFLSFVSLDSCVLPGCYSNAYFVTFVHFRFL
jgi:hypothetical protein